MAPPPNWAEPEALIEPSCSINRAVLFVAFPLVNLKKLPAKLVVEEAEIKLPVVEVAFTWKRAFFSGVVVAPMITDLVVVGERKLMLAISQFSPKDEPPVASSPSQRPAEPVIWAQVAVAAAVQPEPVDINT